MPWYRVELKGGRGHTHEEVEYVWSDLVWSAAEKEARWQIWAGRFSYERTWDGHVTSVKRLPAKVRDAKVGQYRRQIADAEYMLARLAAMGARDAQV